MMFQETTRRMRNFSSVLCIVRPPRSNAAPWNCQRTLSTHRVDNDTKASMSRNSSSEVRTSNNLQSTQSINTAKWDKDRSNELLRSLQALQNGSNSNERTAVVESKPTQPLVPTSQPSIIDKFQQQPVDSGSSRSSYREHVTTNENNKWRSSVYAQQQRQNQNSRSLHQTQYNAHQQSRYHPQSQQQQQHLQRMHQQYRPQQKGNFQNHRDNQSHFDPRLSQQPSPRHEPQNTWDQKDSLSSSKLANKSYVSTSESKSSDSIDEIRKVLMSCNAKKSQQYHLQQGSPLQSHNQEATGIRYKSLDTLRQNSKTRFQDNNHAQKSQLSNTQHLQTNLYTMPNQPTTTASIPSSSLSMSSSAPSNNIFRKQLDQASIQRLNQAQTPRENRSQQGSLLQFRNQDATGIRYSSLDTLGQYSGNFQDSKHAQNLSSPLRNSSNQSQLSMTQKLQTSLDSTPNQPTSTSSMTSSSSSSMSTSAPLNTFFRKQLEQISSQRPIQGQTPRENQSLLNFRESDQISPRLNFRHNRHAADLVSILRGKPDQHWQSSNREGKISTHQDQNHAISSSLQPLSSTNSSVNLEGLSIPEIIRSMQERKTTQNVDRKNQEFRLTGDGTITPKWRQLTDHRREQREADYTRQRQLQQQNLELFQESAEPFYRPDPSTIKPQVVVIPNFDLSLHEASLVFRVKVTDLHAVLQQIQEGDNIDDENDTDKSSKNKSVSAQIMSPETLEQIAILLDIPYERAVPHKGVPNDEERMLQRRAAADQSSETATSTQIETTKEYNSLPPRPPVVSVMGHVDHGKTTLMDALRRRAAGESITKIKKKKKKGGENDSKKKKKNLTDGSSTKDVAGTEAGGITQVITAFEVPLLLDGGSSSVTFLDTPGHAAFSAMRQSGSDAADILVLVVAADDGVSRQTIEILEFYKSIVKGAGGGGISMVVALNKIDKPGINVEEAQLRVQGQLLEHGIVTEGMGSSEESEYGPPVQIFPISALQGIGIDDLIEGLALQSEVMELRADNEAPGEGIVMDARVDKGLGIVADCIIRWGSIKKGDVVVSGSHMGKIKSLKNINDKQIQQGLPSQPVRITGFDSVPKAGDPIVCVKSMAEADELVKKRKAMMEFSSSSSPSTSNYEEAELQSMGSFVMRKDWKETLKKKYGIDSPEESSDRKIRIPVVVKADADGTLAAIRDALVEIGEQSAHSVIIDPIKEGVGPLLATEVQLAKDSDACIVCFNVKFDKTVSNLADKNNVVVLQSDIIYRLLDSAKDQFSKHLPEKPREVVHGRAKVKAVYDIDGMNEQVAGLEVNDGKIFKSAATGVSGKLKTKFRVVRSGQTIAESLDATSLKEFKQDVEEISAGKECGLSLSKFSGYEAGDVIECFSIEMEQPSI